MERRGWADLLRRVLPSGREAGVALVATAVVLVGTILVAELGGGRRPLDAGGLILVLLAGSALAWMRRAPLAVLGAVVLLVSAYLVLGYPYSPIQLCTMVAIGNVGRFCGLRVSLVSCAVSAAVTVAAQLPSAISEATQPLLLVGLLSSWLVVPWSVGALMHGRAAAARRSRVELVARTVLEERMRVAADVHDIAGHNFSVIAMQTGVALLVFDEDPGQVRSALEAIQTTSARALSDLRGMLNALDDGGLDDLTALVDHVRAAGLRVRLDNEPVPVSAETSRVAYRVVREALTNVLRHAGPTVAEVRVGSGRGADAGRLVVEVTDRGARGESDRNEPWPGRGVTGMRDRVSALGGEFVAGPREGGGFRVAALLPFERGAT